MKQIFITNEYRVLEILCTNSVYVKETRFCALHQYEIAEELNLSRANINKIFSNLQSEGYISMITRGRWKISDDAIHLIEVTRQL